VLRSNCPEPALLSHVLAPPIADAQHTYLVLLTLLAHPTCTLSPHWSAANPSMDDTMTCRMNDLIEAILSGDDVRAERALPTIAAHGDIAVSALARQIAGAHADARWWIARTLAAIPTPQSVLLLIQMMDDHDSDVRACAAMALGELHAVEGTDTLIAHLTDESAHVAEVCTMALSRLGTAAVSALVHALQDGDSPTRIRAAKALVPIESHEAIPALIHALDDNDAIVTYYAEDALFRMGVGTVLLKP
jgi:HEAT repeat protein